MFVFRGAPASAIAWPNVAIGTTSIVLLLIWNATRRSNRNYFIDINRGVPTSPEGSTCILFMSCGWKRSP